MSNELKNNENGEQNVVSEENQNVVAETVETVTTEEVVETTETEKAPEPENEIVATEEVANSTDTEKAPEEIETVAENVSEQPKENVVEENNTSYTEKETSVPVVPENFKPELKPTEMPKPDNFRLSITENERAYYEEIIKKQKVTIGTLRKQCFDLISENESLKQTKNDTPAK